MLVRLLWEAAHAIGRHYNFLCEMPPFDPSQPMKRRLNNNSWIDFNIKTKYLIVIKASAQIAGE